ncbi:MAG: lipid-binding SYLF domain-containing protein [Gammaproteobacteria bacterium]|nr:lipid-binding SYLF domain-containing protein [Gammaproteobacteria bacterium]
MKTFLSSWRVLLTALVLLVLPGVVRAHEDDLEKRAAAALESFQKADSTLAAKLSRAAGYAVFPNVGKGGFVIGGAHGRGVAYEGGRVIGRAKITQVTVGAQIGGKAFRELILFETREALDRFKASKFEMNAQASAVAAAEGVSKDARYREGVLVLTQAIRGLMAEASVGGQRFLFEAVDHP